MLNKIIFCVVGSLLIFSCSAQKGLVGTSAVNRIEPVKALEKPEAEQPVNMIVRAFNIADFSHSNKNRFELFVNDQLILPKNRVHNGTRNYIYELKLTPGYYNVRGIYHWHDGIKNIKTKVTVGDLVPVAEGQVTELAVEIDKDLQGFLLNKKPVFSVLQKPLRNVQLANENVLTPLENPKTSFSAEVPKTSKNAAREKNVEENEVMPVEKNLDAVTTQGEQVVTAPLTTQEKRIEVIKEITEAPQKVRLQINTAPDKCDVTIDDEMVGQSPLSIWVDRNSSHVVQIKHPDYKTLLRFVDQEKLKSRDHLILIERLERKVE